MVLSHYDHYDFKALFTPKIQFYIGAMIQMGVMFRGLSVAEASK